MDALRAVPADFFTDLVSDAKIDAAMLLKRNGRMLAAWSRSAVSWDVASIMAATALGSLETFLETLRSPDAQVFSVTGGGHRIHIQKVEPQGIVVLVAKEAIPEAYLRDAARRIIAKLPPPSNGEPPRRVTLGPNFR